MNIIDVYIIAFSMGMWADTVVFIVCFNIVKQYVRRHFCKLRYIYPMFPRTHSRPQRVRESVEKATSVRSQTPNNYDRLIDK